MDWTHGQRGQFPMYRLHGHVTADATGGSPATEALRLKEQKRSIESHLWVVHNAQPSRRQMPCAPGASARLLHGAERGSFRIGIHFRLDPYKWAGLGTRWIRMGT
jgi:hypothetical protein